MLPASGVSLGRPLVRRLRSEDTSKTRMQQTTVMIPDCLHPSVKESLKDEKQSLTKRQIPRATRVFIAFMAVGCGAAQSHRSAPVSPEVEAYQAAVLALATAKTQEELVETSMRVQAFAASCENGGEGPVCDYLRTEGELPPEPPEFTSLHGCWKVVGGQPIICFSSREVAVQTSLGWDRWLAGEPTRADSSERAIYKIEVAHGPLYVEPVSGVEVIHVAIANTLVSARYARVDQSPPQTLPAMDAVCQQLAQCSLALNERQNMACNEPCELMEGDAQARCWNGCLAEDVEEAPSWEPSLRTCHCLLKSALPIDWNQGSGYDHQPAQSPPPPSACVISYKASDIYQCRDRL